MLKTLEAIAQGADVKGWDDQFIVVENIDFKPDDGSSPNLVIDVYEVKGWLLANAKL